MSLTHCTLWHVFIGPLAAIYGRATTHMSKAYAVSSQHSYYNKFNMLLMYCVYYSIEINSIRVDHVMTFFKFLAGSGSMPFCRILMAECISTNTPKKHMAPHSYPRYRSHRHSYPRQEKHFCRRAVAVVWGRDIKGSGEQIASTIMVSSKARNM